jgi:hypothetical protein
MINGRKKIFRFLGGVTPQPPSQTFLTSATFVLTRYYDLEKKKNISIFVLLTFLFF